MNADEIRAIRIEIEQTVWADYEALRCHIEAQIQAIEQADYNVPIEELLELLGIMKRADDYARRAVGLPDKIRDKKLIQNGALQTTILPMAEKD